MNRQTRMLALLLALATLLCLAAPSMAMAETPKPTIATETLWAGCEYYSCVFFNDMPDGAKLISIKSSKPKVIRAEKTGSNIYDDYLVPLKVGKSKITIKYKYQGKTDTLSAVYTVKKYPNPLSQVTVDGKALDIKNNLYYYDCNHYKGTKPLIKVKPAKGWKIDWTWGYTQKPGDDSTFKEFSPRSGKAFKLPKGYEGGAFYTLVNSKGDSIQYGIHFYR